MNRKIHNAPRETARRRSAGEAAPSAEATVTTVVRIVRRLGVVLHAALDCAVRELASNDMVATAETLRDELKPLCDALVHFEANAELEDLTWHSDGDEVDSSAGDERRER